MLPSWAHVVPQVGKFNISVIHGRNHGLMKKMMTLSVKVCACTVGTCRSEAAPRAGEDILSENALF